MDLETVVSSVISSVAARVVVHPIDTLRTVGQTTSASYRMPLWRYWSGLGPSIALSVPGFTTYLVAYRQCKESLAPSLGATSLVNYIASGTVAELASSFIWTPSEVLKGRMQIAKADQTALQLVKNVYKTEGVRGFMHGYYMGLVVFVPHSVIWWVVYEEWREHMSQGNIYSLKPKDHALAASGAMTVATVSTNFIDVVKTRQQLAHSPEVLTLRPTDRLGVRQVARNLIKEVGWRGAFTRGLGMRLLSMVPSSAMAMAVMETLHPDPTIAIVQED